MLRWRVLVCHAADTASLATWLLFGKLIGVTTLVGFGEKRCRKNLPLHDPSQMGFRQNNHEKRKQHDAFIAWRDAASADIELTSLPPTVFETRDDWQYFVDYSYHDTGNWTTPPFTHIDATSDDLTRDQLAAVDRLRRSWDGECERVPILQNRLTRP